MAFAFRRRIKVGRRVNINFSRRRLGVNAGSRAAKISVLSSGRRRVSLGWRRLFRRKQI
jgi:hypothetical protein